jgi:hypothetical protein
MLALLLLVLTHDGILHRFDGHHDTTAAAARARAVAVVAGQVALLGTDALTVDGRVLPGKFSDVRALAGSAQLWGATTTSVVLIDPKSGKRTTQLELANIRHIAADGASVFAEADGVVVEVGSARRWKIVGRPIALAAGDGKLWVATKEGPLWEIDRHSGKSRNLGLGDWWGTVALVHSDALYAVTVAGKIWRIDPARGEKTIVAMDGWQGAIDLAVLR